VLSKLLVSLEESRRSLPPGCQESEQIGFLSELLQSKELHALVKVHNSIEPLHKDERFSPLLSNVIDITEQVLQLLAPEANPEENPEAAEVNI
jgi:hypothetical protein